MQESPNDPERARIDASVRQVVGTLAAELDGPSRTKLAASLIDAATVLLVEAHGREETAVLLSRAVEREIRQLGSCMRWQLV